ncbi:beta-ketoacyl-ACP synthase [Fulvimarina sp. 2208YS6-2-32]|uniref:Beta-ketoacyl-ACP synthase n=1 Tax=Fulvimarina uroteuthidis TaxID=3098149 RepID=A0ABU5I3J9_9HYPH|nr:beta-ketoacyl-ACP synthase [Fulvimarina sp. 2208YS6-2-32]MDY8109927.1 beta-ketoacyl-ACP synthase [Fulvimarina sp. 2208YS6-2-32]
MSSSPRDVLVTGIGLVSSLGEGIDVHLDKLSAPSPSPSVEREAYAPYSVHALPEIDWSAHIPKRGDLRQMDTWQRLGVYAAGLALQDAGIPFDEGLRAEIDMVVAAGGGERDPAVDALVMERARASNAPERVINETLSSELRPTLFLAQLSNLLAGNISIVQKVTGSSRTFMGEEAAGISAFYSTRSRIACGQSEIALVGGSFSAERRDLILNFDLAELMLRNEWSPVLSRRTGADGIAIGSVGAFLILESPDHAERRGANVYARLVSAVGDRGRRDDGRLEKRFSDLLPAVDPADLLILSGASGLADHAKVETEALDAAYPDAARIAYGSMLGHSFEAHVPAGIALAAGALSKRTMFSRTDLANERAQAAPARHALVTTIGHLHAEGACYLEAVS